MNEVQSQPVMALNGNNARGIASFSTSCRTGWLSFPLILEIVRMNHAHWPQQHFEPIIFLAHPNNAWFIIQAVEWSKLKFVGPGLLVYRLATHVDMTSYDEDLRRSLAKVYSLASIKFLPVSIPLMTAYGDTQGTVDSGDVCVLRGDYHVVYMLVKNDDIDNRISYRLLQCHSRLRDTLGWEKPLLNPLSSLLVQEILAVEPLFLLFPQSAPCSWSADLLSLL